MSEQETITAETGTAGEQREGAIEALPTISPTIRSGGVLGRVDGFTLVFEGDLSKFQGNPFKVDTPFGRAIASGLGDAFAKEQEAVDVADALALALLDMMRVIPPSGRTSEQMNAMVAAGKAVALWRDL